MEQQAHLPIRVLLIDDDPLMPVIVSGLLQAKDYAAFALDTVGSLGAGLEKMIERPANVVLLDLGLPDSERETTFERFKRQFPDAPVVVLTHVQDDDLGLRLVKAGAQDFLVKGEITGPLLCRTLSYAIERKRLLIELEQALAEVKTLSGLLPICSGCKKIRDDEGYWSQLETYFQRHSEVRFSHGMCPECLRVYFPGVVIDAPKESAKSHS